LKSGIIVLKNIYRELKKYDSPDEIKKIAVYENKKQ